jgi:hypothetical protein
MSWGLFGHSLTMNFLLGVSIVCVSMHQFFSFGELPGAPGKGHAPAGGAAAAAAAAALAAGSGKGPPSCMIHSPSLEHIRLSPVENGLGSGSGSGSGSTGERAPLLPR